MDVESRPETVYRIRVRGHLGATMLRAFPTLDAWRVGEDTVLSGALPDQAALHGVLSTVESLGIELLDLHRDGR
jgi:hypothetical protein